MKKVIFILILSVLGWFWFYQPKAEWQGQLAPNDPEQVSQDLPSSWSYKNFTITPKARYRIKAIVLSKHSYWAGGNEDLLAPYDLALGWGPLSDAKIINQLNFTQSGRWYRYRWGKDFSMDPSEIIFYSSNHHLVPKDDNVLRDIKHIKKYDVVELEGYLVDIQSQHENWQWHSSMSRTDTAGGSCELMWVTNCLITRP